MIDIVLKYFDDFSDVQLQQMKGLEPLYRSWNEKINVISRKDIDHFYLHHVLHSLAIATQFEFEDDSKIMDLGCGGGFPGVPLAIFFQNVHFHLVDSIRKKLLVVEEVCKELNIQNVTTQHARVEDIKNQKFDTVVSRAVAPLGDLWRWSKPVLRKSTLSHNGLICLKGGDLTKEIQLSGCKPYMWELEQIFDDPYFKEKFLLFQPLKK